MGFSLADGRDFIVLPPMQLTWECICVFQILKAILFKGLCPEPLHGRPWVDPHPEQTSQYRRS